MAAITQPQGFAAHTGRRYGSFAGKTAAGTVVAGPYCVAEAQFFRAGLRQGEVMEAAARAGQVFRAGTRAGQTCCEG